MILTIEIAYQELLETVRRPYPFWGLLRDTVSVQLRELTEPEFHPVADIQLSDGQIRLLAKDGVPWLLLEPRNLDSVSKEERLRQALEQQLLRSGLTRPKAELEEMSRRDRAGRPKFVARPTKLHGNRIELIRVNAQEWANHHLAAVGETVMERGFFVPASGGLDAIPLLVFATGSEMPIALSPDHCTIHDVNDFRDCLDHVAYTAPAVKPVRQGRISIQSLFAQALVDGLNRSGESDIETSLRKIEDSNRPLIANPPVYLDDIDHLEPTYPLRLPFPQYIPGERLGEDVFPDDESEGYFAEEVFVPVIPDHTMCFVTRFTDPHADFKGLLHDGSRFFSLSGVLDNKRPWRGETLDLSLDVGDEYSAAADWLVENANNLGPRHPGHRRWSPKAYGEAVRSAPWDSGATASVRAVESMMLEFAARRIVETKSHGLLYRTPEPVFRVDCRSGGRPTLDVCFSWRRHVSAIPMRGRPVPFLFPLTSYGEAVDFLHVFGRKAETVCGDPEILDAKVFSSNFDAWNLKASMVHILSGADGRLGLLPQDTIEAGLRIARHLDLWCVDATTADASQPQEFEYDCRLLLEAFMDPLMGWLAPPLLLDFAHELAEGYAFRDPGSAVEDTDETMDNGIYSL